MSAPIGRPKGCQKFGGRKKGTPNKATSDFRAAVTRILNEADIPALLEDVPKERRLELLGKLAEYAFPKLARTEMTGADGGPVIFEFPPIPAP